MGMSRATLGMHFMGGLSLLALAASIASGQSTISGVVKDSTGAIIANATVEASSDVLIERTRTVTTDSLGRYAIIDLRPGSYVVTVTQSGFAAMKETVNVEAIPATVDVENVAHPETLTRAEMDVLPTGRYMQSIASYVPGAHLNLPDIGGSQQIEQNYITLHGASATANVYMFDGMLVNTTYNDGAI